MSLPLRHGDNPGVATSPPLPLLLVVDDQPSNIQTLYGIFKDDFEVCMATDGAAALLFCAQRVPDVILLDVVMPGLSGYVLCDQLKRDPRLMDVPVIFVTGNSDPLDEVHGFEVGGVDFIIKPFHATVVRARVRTHLTLKLQADQLRDLAMVDGLTGVANRRRFDQSLESEWRRCGRSMQPLALMMIDVDHFKRYNDHHGHQQGDMCLRRIAAILARGVRRPHDLVARYGGEEFVCLLPDTALAGALGIAEEIEAEVRAHTIVHGDSPTSPWVTVSIGVAGIAMPAPDDAWHALVSAADRQLYRAKNEGRARVCAQTLAPAWTPACDSDLPGAQAL